MARKTVEERFWPKVNIIDDENSCWEWNAYRHSNGYGYLGFWDASSRTNYSRAAHIVSYEINLGPVTKGLFVLHDCDNRACVRPAHLHLGTKSQNTQEMWDRLRREDRTWGRALTETKLTECPRKHPYDDDNTYFDKNGYRSCKECRRAAAIKYYYASGNGAKKRRNQANNG